MTLSDVGQPPLPAVDQFHSGHQKARSIKKALRASGSQGLLLSRLLQTLRWPGIERAQIPLAERKTYDRVSHAHGLLRDASGCA
jgi:hypothetical protein